MGGRTTNKRYFALEGALGILLFMAVAGSFELTQANEELELATNTHMAVCARFDRSNMLQRMPRQHIPNLRSAAVAGDQ
ncbi:MAG: hypothetical protein ACT4PL_10010 [Phycisphaerales bacterium]